MATLLTTSWKNIGSKTIANTGYGNIVLRIYAKYNSQSLANNNTNVSRKLVLYLSAGTFYSNGCSYSLTGCGSKSGQNLSKNSAGEMTLLSEAKANVAHNNDGSSKTTTLTCSYDIYGASGSFTAQFTVPKINRLATVSNATNFNDESNPTVTFTNPGGFSARPYIDFYNTAGTKVFGIERSTGVSSPYTWSLTDEERDTIRNTLNKQKTYNAHIGIHTYNGSTSLGYSKQIKMFTIINAEPTFTKIMAETNQKAINLLGLTADNLIKNASTPKILVNPTALKGATISSVAVSCLDGQAYSLTTEPYEKVFNPVGSSQFNIVVTDSRGYQTTETITKNLIDYEPIVINKVSFTRESPVSSNIDLKADIKYFQVTFDEIANQPTIKWGMSQNGEEINWHDLEDFTIDEENKKIIINTKLNDVLPYIEKANFYLKVSDLISEKQDGNEVLKGVPTYEAGDTDLQVNGDLFIADTNRENKINVKEILEKQQPGAMTARMSENFTMANNTDSQVLPINHVISSTGDKLSIASDGIRIGPGVNYVMISAQVYFYTNVLTTSDTICFMQRYRDGTTSTIVTHNQRLADNYEHVTLPTRMVYVEEGDIIRLAVQNNTSKATVIQGTYDTGTFLTVQVV